MHRNHIDVHKDGILLQVLQVEVVHCVFEPEQGVVIWLHSKACVCILRVMVEEVHSQDCLELVRLHHILALIDYLIDHVHIESSSGDSEIKQVLSVS